MTQFTFHKGHVLRVLLKKDLPKFNLIYASGMFDYFNIEQSKKIAKKLWDCLEPGGVLIITNAHPSNPTRFWMEYSMGWYLIYKTRKNMEEVSEYIQQNLLQSSIDVDENKIYQYLKITKPLC